MNGLYISKYRERPNKSLWVSVKYSVYYFFCKQDCHYHRMISIQKEAVMVKQLLDYYFNFIVSWFSDQIYSSIFWSVEKLTVIIIFITYMYFGKWNISRQVCWAITPTNSIYARFMVARKLGGLFELISWLIYLKR